MTSITWTTNDTQAEFTESGDSVFSSTVTEHELRFDADLRETHTHASTITDRAVDTAQPVVFAKRAMPDKIQLEGVLTETPIGDSPPSGLGTEPKVGTIRALEVSPGARANVLQFDEPLERIHTVHNVLVQLANEAIEVTVATASRTYSAVMIESAEISRQSGEGGSASVDVTLRSIRRATTRTVAADAIAREPRRQPPRDRGHQETQPSDSSDLQRIADSIRRGTVLQDFQSLIGGGATP